MRRFETDHPLHPIRLLQEVLGARTTSIGKLSSVLMSIQERMVLENGGDRDLVSKIVFPYRMILNHMYSFQNHDNIVDPVFAPRPSFKRAKLSHDPTGNMVMIPQCSLVFTSRLNNVLAMDHYEQVVRINVSPDEYDYDPDTKTVHHRGHGMRWFIDGVLSAIPFTRQRKAHMILSSMGDYHIHVKCCDFGNSGAKVFQVFDADGNAIDMKVVIYTE